MLLGLGSGLSPTVFDQAMNRLGRHQVDTNRHGQFDRDCGAYDIHTPLTPRPWINYLGNRRLRAFISQQAGGLLWYHEPQTRRITRYHYTASPADQPGFYLYVQDLETGGLWNPHFAPTCSPVERFCCRHEPGITRFSAEADGIAVTVEYVIAPDDDALLWRVRVDNRRPRAARVRLCSYVEFGLLEFMREVIAWCYLKNHNAFRFDTATETIRYEYHVFEAPHTPKMAMGCSGELSGFTCSREAFLGPTGSLRRPDALAEGALGGEELPLGGHGCGVLARELHLEAGTGQDLTYILAVGDTWGQVDAMIETFSDPAESAQAVTAVRRFWSERLSRFQVASQDPIVDAFVNVWNPVNAMVACELARSISTDHMGLDGLRYRDTMQDALAVAHLDAEYAADRVRLVLAQQTAEGAGCFAFYPDSPQPTCDQPDRSDNTVWPIYTVENLLAETGDLSLLAEEVPYRDGSRGSVFDHLLRGLKYVHRRRGPNGLPLLAHADWNDGLALFQDERAESVMLAMQMVASCRRLAEMADRLGRSREADWCRSAADDYDQAVNSDAVWDGRWYRRLILSDGTSIGSADRRQGQIFLTVQAWSVISGVARDGRGKAAMDAVADRLDSECGLAILDPPFVGFPEPEDPPLGSNPGVGENGGIFCHANTWAIIAEAMLGRADRAWKYYRQLLPPHVIDRYGVQHYQREPYVYVSSIVGPCSERLGEGGISWLTGTASWMYEAVTKHLLGVLPTMDGLRIRPCLDGEGPPVRVQRRFRGCRYDIDVQPGAGPRSLLVNGEAQSGDLISPAGQATCHVQSVVTSR